MASGGTDIDPDGTFPGGEGDTSDTTPLNPHRSEEEIGLKTRKPPGFQKIPPPKTSTSTSHRHTDETSFIEGTPSGKFYTSIREQQMEEIEGRVKEKFPDVDMSKFQSRMDEYGRVFIKLFASNSKDYLLIDMNGDLADLKKIRKGSQTLNAALGMTVEEKANETIARETARKEKAEAKIRELEERKENTFPEDIERIDNEIAREQEEANEAEQNIEREQAKLTLRQRIKAIFKKYGFTAFAVATAIATVIDVIVSNLKAGLAKVAKGVGNGLKELGKKLGEILPGMIGAIASFIFRTAGEVIGFLAKNAWLLIVGLVVLAVEQLKKKSK